MTITERWPCAGLAAGRFPQRRALGSALFRYGCPPSRPCLSRRGLLLRCLVLLCLPIAVPALSWCGTDRYRKPDVGNADGSQGAQVGQSATTVCRTVSASPVTRSVTGRPPGTTSDDRRHRMAVHESGSQSPVT